MTLEDENVLSAVHSCLDALDIHGRSLDISECSPASLYKWMAEYPGRKLFAVIDQKALNDGFIEKSGLDRDGHPALQVVLIPDRNFDEKKNKLPDFVSILKCPITTLGLYSLISGRDSKEQSPSEKKEGLKFTAPEAKVMVVDDIPMNLKLAERLLARLEIKADLASSGQDALELLVKGQYDIIFMDHMMPGLDGIDTTRLIRRFHTRYNKTPIIALTANVMEDAKKMFIDEGMSDIIPKPIEVKTLNEKLLKWLPPEKIVPVNNP
jgi:CheY-like chemotaxis protein